MIAGLFPNRTRRQIKAKWNKEDKLNPTGITAALMSRKAISGSPLSLPVHRVTFADASARADLEHYAAVTGQDLSGPIPIDPMDKINELRAEQEQQEKENGGRYLPKEHGGTGGGGGGGGRKGKKGGKLQQVPEEVEQPAEEQEEEEDQEEALRREEAEQAALDEEIAAGLAEEEAREAAKQR